MTWYALRAIAAVATNRYLRSSCDPVAIRHSILDIAQWADDVEQALTDDDRF